MLEARLKVMQARIEPQFLFNTLAQVRKLYHIDAALSGEMLDQLIAYLRAAMPRMRDTSSTLGQELELVASYLAIIKIRMGGRLEFSIDTSAELTDARMPPMMLLPLVDHAVVHGLEAPHGEGTLRIQSAVQGSRLQLSIHDDGAGFVPEDAGDAVAAIRERLHALYGGNATLTLER